MDFMEYYLYIHRYLSPLAREYLLLANIVEIIESRSIIIYKYLLIMPNTLVVSTFGCPFSEFEAMVKKVDKEQGYVFCSELEIVKVNEYKAMILMNCSDLEKFGAMLEQPELKQWDIDNNCVDTVYDLKLVS